MAGSGRNGLVQEVYQSIACGDHLHWSHKWVVPEPSTKHCEGGPNLNPGGLVECQASERG